MLESAPDGIVLADAEGRIELVNKRTEELFGYGRVELVGRPVELLVPERFRRLHQEHRRSYLGSPSPRPMGIGLELFGRRRHGSEFPVDISLSPAPTSAGTLVITIVRDASEQRRAEAQRLALAREQAARAEAEETARRLASLQAVSDAALRHLSLDQLLGAVLEQAVRSLGGSTGAILLRDDAGGDGLLVRAEH